MKIKNNLGRSTLIKAGIATGVFLLLSIPLLKDNVKSSQVNATKVAKTGELKDCGTTYIQKGNNRYEVLVLEDTVHNKILYIPMMKVTLCGKMEIVSPYISITDKE